MTRYHKMPCGYCGRLFAQADALERHRKVCKKNPQRESGPEFIERARRAQQAHNQQHDVQLGLDEKQTIDKYGRVWALPWSELCATCGQPDNTGDCDHTKLTDDQVARLLEGGE